MRIAGIVALGLLFLPMQAMAAGDAWFTLNDPDGVFRVEMPQEPVMATRTVPGPDGRQQKEVRYLFESGGRMMLVLVADQAGPPGVALDRTVTGLQSHGRRLLSDVGVTLDGHAGRDVVLVTAKGSTLRDRLFLVGNRLYQAFAGLPANAPKDEVDAADRYAHSLHFLK